jgi:hypothetical protein
MLGIHLFHMRPKEFIVKYTKEYYNIFKIPNIDTDCNIVSQQAEVAQSVPCRLRPRIFLTFCTTRVVGRLPYAPLCLYPRGNSWNSFLLESDSTPGHIFPSVATENSSVTPPGIDPDTVRLVTQYPKH